MFCFRRDWFSAGPHSFFSLGQDFPRRPPGREGLKSRAWLWSRDGSPRRRPRPRPGPRCFSDVRKSRPEYLETTAKLRLPAELIVGLRLEVLEIGFLFLRPLDFVRGREPVERLRSSPSSISSRNPVFCSGLIRQDLQAGLMEERRALLILAW